MSTTAEIEDAIIQAVKDLGLFRKVQSAGRAEVPQALSYPVAFVYFKSDSDSSVPPRPVVDMEFEVVVMAKNLSSEEKAAEDTYALLDAVRDAFNGKLLGLDDVETFKVTAREILTYEAGVITYTIRLSTRHILPVPGN